ncbi:hypothetical protein [Sphingobium cloacae]|nr:hypothetical protein [Sphingobium cloacae]
MPGWQKRRMLNPIDRCVRIPSADKARLRLLFLAKHARASGNPDAVDGNHALYHHEMRATLEEIGLDIRVADSYDALFERPDADFVVTLLNRGGFQNSEMMAPLLLSWRDVPHLGAARSRDDRRAGQRPLPVVRKAAPRGSERAGGYFGRAADAGRRMKTARPSFHRQWGWPTGMAVLSMFGLLSALLGEGGIWWWLSWATPAAPLLVIIYHGNQTRVSAVREQLKYVDEYPCI